MLLDVVLKIRVELVFHYLLEGLGLFSEVAWVVPQVKRQNSRVLKYCFCEVFKTFD